MAGRTRCRSNFGYGVLLIDPQAHGESANERISIVVHEAESMRPRWRTLVANSRASKSESPASRSAIEEAIGNPMRLYVGSAGGALAPLQLLQVGYGWTRPWISCGRSTRRALLCLTLVVGGEFDRHTSEFETRRIHPAVPEPT